MAKIDDILDKLQKATLGKLNTSQGNNNGVYKESIFEGMTDKQKGHERTKIRKKVINIFETITSTFCSESNKKLLIEAFLDFYKETYICNDFSVASICNDNSKHKELFEKGLAICKEFQTKQNKKSK